MDKILLHICCGVCCGHAVQQLQADGFEVTGYFCNPNIEPEEEYAKRLQAAKDAASALGIKLFAGQYDNSGWREAVKGLEQEPEGGKRCPVCFEFRIRETLRKAKELGIPYIASTLSISPHKNTEVINQIGFKLGREAFKPYNFKKQDGFKKTSAFARQHSLYRQRYCGCLFPKTFSYPIGKVPPKGEIY